MLGSAAMPSQRSGNWPGGYIRTDKNGRQTFYIAREVGGHRYEVSTRAHSLRPAMAQLEAFEADPDHYNPARASADEELLLDDVLVGKFLAWSKAKGNTPKHQRAQKRYLTWWCEQLFGVDLHQLGMREHVIPALDQAKVARHLRIAALKTLTNWLFRERFELRTDPIAALKVPQVQPEQRRRRKARTKGELEKTRRLLSAYWRVPFDLQLGTAWHLTELERWAAGGTEERATADHRKSGAVRVLVVRHKRGDDVRTPVTAAVLRAARELRKRGGISISRYCAAVREASLAAGEQWSPGQMRHSVLTLALKGGATLQETSEFAHHADPRTTRRFYADAAPRKVPTLR